MPVTNTDPMPAQTGGPGADVPVSSEEDLYVIEAIRRFKIESEDAKVDRLRKNESNRNAYFGRQDFSHKMDGQSAEFLPKVSTSVEQMCAFVKRGLVQFGDWFSVELDRSINDLIDGSQVRAIMMPFMDNLWTRNQQNLAFSTVISDGVKIALLESLVILKVHGGLQKTRKFKFKSEADEDGAIKEALEVEETDEWRLRIDLVRPEDYYPDPTGNGLYEIHRVERDLHEIIEGAENGLYDKAAVKMLIDVDFPRPTDEERSDEDRNQPQAYPPAFRKRVVLDEFWGTLLNSDGTVAHHNVVCTIANDRYVIRKPEPNPFWHQESPFVAEPLIRVPFSVWHKALYDQACDLNISINEMFNLMLDGGMAAVWGVKQLRIEDLEDPNQVSGGLKQGMTLAVKQTLPHNAKVVETVATGNVPQDAMLVFEALQREYVQAALTNELKLGQMPAKRVLATEVVESSQSQAITLDGIVADLENTVIVPVLRKAWLTILQNADDIPETAMKSAVNKQIAMFLMRASPEERFGLFAGKAQFRAFGLSGTMQKALDFQKSMAFLQAVTQNPVVYASFMKKFSGDKMLRKLMRTLNMNPDDIEKDEEEMKTAEADNQSTMAIMQAMNGGGNASASASGNGGGGPGSETAAEINQNANPMGGLVPTA
jgi:hypothetical protein